MSAETIREYHERTKHSYESVRRSPGFLDWENVPSRFKQYVGLEPALLPEVASTGVPCHEVIAGSAAPNGDSDLDLEVLSHLLFHAAGVSREIQTVDGSLHFRTYASAGALYPIEAYVVAGDLDGLDAGVYHYAPLEHGLTRLRSGDVRGSIGLADEEPGAATLVLSGIPWRTAWKYRTRGLRHLWWDAGMILANLLGAAAATGVRARVVLGFIDESANRGLGLDGSTEFALCAVPLGRGTSSSPREVEPLELEVAPVSARPERDPVIERAHEALVLRSEKDAAAFRAQGPEEPEGPDTSDRRREAGPLREQALSRDSFEDVVRRRGSSRRQAREPFPAAEYAAILDRALGGIPSDWTGASPIAHVVANALDGLTAGAFRYEAGGTFHPVLEEDLRRRAGFLCLEQRLGADAAAVTFLMADLARAFPSLGARGYAAGQLEAAIVAGRIYLGAYAQCLGASGITFYDDEARRSFETDREPMLAVVTGPEGSRGSIIRCRESRAPAGSAAG